MIDRTMLGVFERADDIVRAARAARGRGFRIVDAYTPFAVHGLDDAMGLGASWLSGLALALGLAGAGFATWLQYWTSAVSWPLNVGGRPLNSLPAFVPVIFEVAVLSAGVGVVIAFLASRRLWPGQPAVLPHPAVTNDRFVLVLDATGTVDDVTTMRRLLDEHGARQVEERV